MSVCAFAEFYENVDSANFVIYDESIDIKEYLRQEREYEKDRNKNDLCTLWKRLKQKKRQTSSISE